MFSWLLFFIVIASMILLDLGVFHKKNHVVTVKSALIWTIVWFGLSLLFNVYIFYTKGSQASIDFLTGYLIEKSLSLDNVFIFLTIFQSFKIPLKYQHKVLLWGILGAVVLRGLFISAGAVLIEQFSWIFYVFGMFLIYTAYGFMKAETPENDFSQHPCIRWCKKHFAISDRLEGNKFFTLEQGKKVATPLLLALLTIEFADVIFAIDSIPAIFAITTDPYIVFTSNIFAILGLRSLYFIIAHMAVTFVYLSYGLGFILGFIGLKMILHQVIHIPSFLSLSVIGFALSISIIASLALEKKQNNK